MIRQFTLIFLFYHFTISAFSQFQIPDYDEVYPKDEISRIDVFMDADSLEIMVEDIFTEHKYPASIIFSNSKVQDTIDNIGIRIRGNTSQSAGKKSFKLSFNAFEKGAKFNGYEHFNLNGEHNDPSIMRSKLCWDLLQKTSFPAPRASYVELYFNNEFKGVYINVEHIDEQFVQSRFYNNDGNLYKCTYPADLHYKGEDPELYKEAFWGKRAYELKTNEEDDDYSDLANFIDVLNNTSSTDFICELEKVFNVDHYMLAMALDILTGNWDGPLFNKNNFYLYHNECTDKFEYIPYDLDNTFGIDWFGIDWSQRNIYNWSNPNEYRPLFERILDQDEYKAQLTSILEGLLANEFANLSINNEINTYKTLIGDLVSQDSYYSLDYGYSYEDFLLSFDQGLGGHVPFGLKEYINLRRNSALSQLLNSEAEPMVYYVDFKYSDAPSEGIVFTSMAWDKPIEQVTLYSKKGNEGWKTNSMLDNGINGDEMQGDDIYSYVLSDWEYGKDIQYYVEIVSSNSKINRYPECETYLIDLTSEIPALHLNEWMASNKTTIADEAGNFPDWIELYNSGDKPIYLGDKYLSDDNDDRTKWRMPDAVIYPGQFLLFWADNDEEEGIYHTNFKLSVSGEHIGIYDSKQYDHRRIDGVDFGAQSEDISEGLLTDGGETIVFFNEPTPKASNEPVSVVDDQGITFTLHPNPASNFIKVGSSASYDYDLQIFMYDGRIVYDNYGLEGEILISTQDWQAGNYVVRIVSGTGLVGIKKLVVLGG